MTEHSELARIRDIVEPVASDLDLDVYDIERRGVTVRVTLDTHPGSDGGITLDNLSLATRLISREIDHEDPITSRFTLEVTSPGLERHLRTPRHFQREVGKDITVRFRDPNAEPRRIEGQLTAADEANVTMLLDDATERTFAIDEVDKARTVFEWGPADKPNAPKQHGKNAGNKQAGNKQAGNKNKQAKNAPGNKQQAAGKPKKSTATQKETQTS